MSIEKEIASGSDAQKLHACIEPRIQSIPEGSKRRAAIFTHATPDPDALGSQVACALLLSSKYGVEVDCFVDGNISHPQNRVVVQLLDPHLINVKRYKEEDYFLKILVDTVPEHAGVGPHEVKFDVVIDHHKVLPGELFKGLLIHHHSGSCSAIIEELLYDYGIRFIDEDEEHQKVATGILAGILTDTDYLTKEDITARDFAAQQRMTHFADHAAVRKIVRFNWPMSWVKLMGVAINDHVVDSGIAVVGLGMLDGEQHDAVAAIADFMLQWANVHTAVAFAFFDRQYISGCLRTVDNTVESHALCAQLGSEYGEGGGKSFQGRYTKPLGAFCFELDEPDDVIERWWDLQRDREVRKILKVLNK